MMNSKSSPLRTDDLPLDNEKSGNTENKKEAILLKELTLSLSYGDEKAWEELYLIFFDPLVVFLNHLIRSHDDSCDVAQEVFISLWQNHRKFNGETNIKRYLFAMAKNSAFDFLKKRNKQSGFTSPELVEPTDLGFAPDDLIMADEAKIIINMVLETMPKQRRRIFEMSRFDGKSNAEIAELLNITKRTVVNQITESLKELRGVLNCIAFFLA